MSIYHFSVNIQSRTLGSSPLATFAYQFRTKVYDPFIKKTFNYHGNDMAFSGVKLPANAPDKFNDPFILWSDVLKNETQHDAQLCRRFNCSLPNELSDEENKIIINKFVSFLAEQGMCVTYAYHNKKNNKHLHIQATCRGLDSNGNWEQIKTKKDYRLDAKGNRIPVILDDNGKKLPIEKVLDENGVVRANLDLTKQKKGTRNALIWERIAVKGKSGKSFEWDKKTSLELWRKNWAEICNLQLKESGINSKIDHRSIERQYIESKLSEDKARHLTLEEKIVFLENELLKLEQKQSQVRNDKKVITCEYDLDKEYSYDKYSIEQYRIESYSNIGNIIGKGISKREILYSDVLLPEVQTSNMVNIGWGATSNYVPMQPIKNKIILESRPEYSTSEMVFIKGISDFSCELPKPKKALNIPDLSSGTENIFKKNITSAELTEKSDLEKTKSIGYDRPSLTKSLSSIFKEISLSIKEKVVDFIKPKIQKYTVTIPKLLTEAIKSISVSSYEICQKTIDKKGYFSDEYKIDKELGFSWNDNYDDITKEPNVFLINSDWFSAKDFDDMIVNKEIDVETLRTILIEQRDDYWELYKNNSELESIKSYGQKDGSNEDLQDKNEGKKHGRRI